MRQLDRAKSTLRACALTAITGKGTFLPSTE
jgi:hypothetical protein